MFVHHVLSGTSEGGGLTSVMESISYWSGMVGVRVWQTSRQPRLINVS